MAWATLRQRSLEVCVQHGSAPGWRAVAGRTLDRQPAPLLGGLALDWHTATGTAVLLRWLAGNRSRAALLGPEVTSSSVQSLTTLPCIICARRAAWRRDSMLLPVQHSTARHSTTQYGKAQYRVMS